MGQLLGGKWLGKEERGRVAWWALRWTDGFMDGYMESGSEIFLVCQEPCIQRSILHE